jgi:hypothetical protein
MIQFLFSAITMTLAAAGPLPKSDPQMSLINHPRRLFLYVAEPPPSSSAVQPLVVDVDMSPSKNVRRPKRSGLAAAILVAQEAIFAGSNPASAAISGSTPSRVSSSCEIRINGRSGRSFLCAARMASPTPERRQVSSVAIPPTLSLR